jgi:xanthine/uracil permease
MEAKDTRSIPEIVSALTDDLANLVRKESELVRTEVTEKLHQTTRAGMMLAIGGALLIGAFLVLLQALVLALSKFMDPLWASLVVGVVVGLIGFMLIRSGTHKVKPAELMPERSSRQIQKDAQMVKGQAK